MRWDTKSVPSTSSSVIVRASVAMRLSSCDSVIVWACLKILYTLGYFFHFFSFIIITIFPFFTKWHAENSHVPGTW